MKTELSMHELGEDHDWTGWGTPEAVVPAVVLPRRADGRGFTGRIVESTQFGSAGPDPRGVTDRAGTTACDHRDRRRPGPSRNDR